MKLGFTGARCGIRDLRLFRDDAYKPGPAPKRTVSCSERGREPPYSTAKGTLILSPYPRTLRDHNCIPNGQANNAQPCIIETTPSRKAGNAIPNLTLRVGKPSSPKHVDEFCLHSTRLLNQTGLERILWVNLSIGEVRLEMIGRGYCGKRWMAKNEC